MLQKYIKYIPVYLDRRGYYTISHQVRIPALEGKVVIKDEPILGIQTPNSIYDYGIIEIVDETVATDVQDLLDNMGVAVGMKEITATEMKTALLDNGYTETSPGIVEIQAEYIDEMTGETVTAKTIDFN